MTLKTWKNFKKRKNSTKQPNDADAVSIDVYLKNETSLESPTFVVDGIDVDINYCQYNGHYYYVDDIILSHNNIYEIVCTEDDLASHKSEILSTSCNILYATDADVFIPDTRIPLTSDVIETTTYTPIDGVTFKDNEYNIIITVTGTGSFGTFLLQPANAIKNLINNVQLTIDQLTDPEVLKNILFCGNAADCIKSVIALPMTIDASDVGGGSYPIRLGSYTTGYNGTAVDNMYKKSTTNITIPWNYSDWRQAEPYSNIYLHLPFVGTIHLPSKDFIGEDSVKVNMSLCYGNGDLTYEIVSPKSQKIVANASCNIALSVPYGSNAINTGKLVSASVAGIASEIGAIAALGSGNILGVGLVGAGLAAAASGTIAALSDNGSGAGSLGGPAAVGLNKSYGITVVSAKLVAEQSTYNNIMGKPFMKVGTPDMFRGYVQTDGFQFNGSGFGSSKNRINSMMDAGVYIE